MRLFVFVAAILFIGCVNNGKDFLNAENKLKQAVPDSSYQYFPADSSVKIKNGEDGGAGYQRRSASDILFNLREPLLYNYLGEGEFIRLTWLRTFYNPVVVRVSNFNDIVYISIKELKSKASENDIPKVLKDTSIILPSERWRGMLATLQENNYWNEMRSDTALEGKDGIPWFLECKLHNKYHYISRWDDGNFSSEDLNSYAKDIIDIASQHLTMKSSK